MTSSLQDAWQEASAQIRWSALGHVYCFCNGKGGVGKTTSCSHFAALLSVERRVLIIDLNGQGNIAQDFGYTRKEGVDDRGENLFRAIAFGEPLRPVTIRRNIDVVPGGAAIRRITGALSSEMSSPESAARALLNLARALVPLAGNYDVILIDSPPENPPLQKLVLAASRFILVPMHTDQSSRWGLVDLAEEIRQARSVNPYLTLLGVFVFASMLNSTSIRKALRDGVVADLKDPAYFLNTFIRFSEAAAEKVRSRGEVVSELELKIKDNPKFWAIRAGEASKADTVPSTAAGIAEDYLNLVREALGRANELRLTMIKNGVWPR